MMPWWMMGGCWPQEQCDGEVQYEGKDNEMFNEDDEDGGGEGEGGDRKSTRLNSSHWE